MSENSGIEFEADMSPFLVYLEAMALWMRENKREFEKPLSEDLMSSDYVDIKALPFLDRIRVIGYPSEALQCLFARMRDEVPKTGNADLE